MAGLAALFAAAGSVLTTLGHTDALEIDGALPGLAAARRLATELEPGEHGTPQAGGDRLGADPFVIRFENVSFHYPGTDRAILRGLDLTVHPGELLAIVGLNGAGKSTLIKLLAGLYRPTSGRITANGIDIATLKPGEWRGRLAMVFQDFVRYPLSLRENITVGREGAAPWQARLAGTAEDAGLTELVAALPAGWETPLSRSRSGGVDLSGGEWQQVVLARALFAVRSEARFLVLDEPTAHLDARTEFDVFRRIAARRAEAGIVLISHRLSTVRAADRIILLEGGRVTESGTHQELMTRRGTYARLFTLQAQRLRAGHDDRQEEEAS